MKTMTAKEAYDRSQKKGYFSYGSLGHYFALVGWKSPDNGSESGPFLVTISGDRCVEIEWDGRFRDIYPATAEYYFPWIVGTHSKERTETIRKIARSILKNELDKPKKKKKNG